MAAQARGDAAEMWFDGRRPNRNARDLVALLERADEHGLDPADYRLDDIRRALDTEKGADREAASALLSEALASYARDLAVPRGLEDVTYIDAELQPAAPDPAALAADGKLGKSLRALHQSNPLYEELRAGLADYRRTWSRLPQTPIPEGPTLAVGSRGPRVALLKQRLGLASGTADGDRYDAALGEAVKTFREAHGLAPRPVADAATIAALNRGAAHYEGIIIANLDRLRGLPRDGGRYVLVDTAAAQLRLIEDGEEVDSMRVVVGKPGMETPLLAGFIRYAMVNPYWNVPPDLVRNTIAPAVLRSGSAALQYGPYVLSPDWRSQERVDPVRVDWAAVAAGRESIWVRQLPGGRNMMGDVKFMLPNEMGIYLHDTPNKALFQRDNRRLSSGCVRVEDAARLGEWLFRRPILGGDDRTPDRRVDLDDPVPVFITYLTASAEKGRISFRRDVESRDSPLLANTRTAAK